MGDKASSSMKRELHKFYRPCHLSHTRNTLFDDTFLELYCHAELMRSTLMSSWHANTARNAWAYQNEITLQVKICYLTDRGWTPKFRIFVVLLHSPGPENLNTESEK